MRLASSTKAWIGTLGVAASALLVSGPAVAANIQYHQIASIAVPASPNHGDVVAYDPGSHLVYAAYGAGGLAVINANTNKLVTTVPGIKKPNGVDFNAQYVFVADGTSNTLDVISKSTWKVVNTISTTATDKTATTPDGVVVDHVNHQVFVTIDDNNTVQVYSDAAPFKLVTTIDLNKVVPNASIFNVGPDLAWLSNGTFYESDGNFLLSYNAKTFQNTGKIDSKLTLKGADGKLVRFAGLKEPVLADNKIFIGGNGTGPVELYVFNAALTQQYAPISLPAGPDQMTYNAQNGMVYGFTAGLSGKGGFIVINPATDQLVTSVVSGGGAHTGAVNPSNGDVYVLANGSATNPASAAVEVFAPETGSTTVPNATSPVTGVPTLPLVGGTALVVLGAAALYANRRMANR